MDGLASSADSCKQVFWHLWLASIFLMAVLSARRASGPITTHSNMFIALMCRPWLHTIPKALSSAKWSA